MSCCAMSKGKLYYVRIIFIPKKVVYAINNIKSNLAVHFFLNMVLNQPGNVIKFRNAVTEEHIGFSFLET